MSKTLNTTPPDAISRYREDEEQDAECRMQAIVADCEKRVTAARQEFSIVKASINTDRMRLRHDTSGYYDAEFAAAVLPRLQQGIYTRVEETP